MAEATSCWMARISPLESSPRVLTMMAAEGCWRVAAEQFALGQDEMHARRLDAGQRGDGAGELALERPDLVDVLDEARGAERVLLVKDFVADLAAMWAGRSGPASCAGW